MNEGRPANLVWSLAGKEIMVQSPLSSSVMRQRSSMNTGGEWQPEFGRIAAKDFAILGRMTDGSHHESQIEEPLRDYFSSASEAWEHGAPDRLLTGAVDS